MLRSIRSAWVALRRPAVLLGTAAAAAGFALLATVISITTATRTAQDVPDFGPEIATVASLGSADGIVHGLGQASTFLGVLAVGVAAFAFAADHQHGTLRTLLVRSPRRWVLLAGKSVALLGVLVLAALAATFTATVGALAVADGQGVDTSAWALTEVLEAFLRTAVAMAGYGLLGAALAVLLRSSVAAVGVGVAWFLPVEQIVAGAWSGAQDVLPGQLLAGLLDGTAGGGQTAVLAVWLAGAAAVALATFTRRDVLA